jgi:nucleoside-diphosphate-sugar epimerase
MVKEIVEVTKGESCRLIFISTSYLNVQELLGADKNQLNLYAASKAMAETYLRTEELSFFGVYVLRLPVLLSSGPQANSFLDVAFQVISGGEPLTLYNAKEPFPVTDAEEVMAMVRCLAKKGPKGFHVITLGARDTLSLEEIIESFKEGFSPSGGHQSMIGRRGSDVLTNPFLQEIGFKASTSFEIVSRFMKKAIGPINATT